MNYIGENLLPGNIGHFFVVLSLIASIVATFGYYKSVTAKNPIDEESWKKLARYSFFVEALSVFIIFITLFYILKNHLFEYKYAWQHTSKSLEPKFLFAAFWEGQEGSTLLWSFWHCVLGLVVIFGNKKWEAPVMTFISFIQILLAAMVLGVYIGDHFIGVNPFQLLRDSNVLDKAPAMHVGFDLSQPIRPDYLSMITDGNDLNPLLQNYWMTIHPPVLFLGFASTIVPFAYALAGLWTGETKEWVKPALPWSLFTIATLGTGLMMGAKWAYESLNFGGYWAWDPVENASLVPWLIMVAGAHTLMIYKHTGRSLKSTFLFFILAFVFIVYSTYLTKSGILGDASVHAFTDNGLNTQLFLLMYLGVWIAPFIAAKTKMAQLQVFVAGIIIMFLIYFLYDKLQSIGMIGLLIGLGWFIFLLNKQVSDTRKDEESISSREFWMFIGSLVFFLSALIITVQTSLPVFNRIFGINIATPENHEFAYNQIQVMVAIIIGIITAFAQYLKYKKTDKKFFFNKITIPTLISIIVATLILKFIKINYTKEGLGFLLNIWIALVAGVYTVIANAAYIWIGNKGQWKKAGGSIAHLGFGMVIVGILLSAGKKEVLSINTSGISVEFNEKSKENTGENLTLVEGIPTSMGKYKVTYDGDSTHPTKKSLNYFKIHFNSDKENFTLHPNSFVNYKGNNELMSNPDARHYWNKDVFTYITSIYNSDQMEDTTQFTTYHKKIGDSIYYSKGFIVLENLIAKDNLPGTNFKNTDSGFNASIKVSTLLGPTYESELLTIKSGNKAVYNSIDTVFSQGLILTMPNVTDGVAQIDVKETDKIMKYVTLKAYVFPYINVLWIGVIITVLGTIISIIHRVRTKKG